jgi:hypothetical protein
VKKVSKHLNFKEKKEAAVFAQPFFSNQPIYCERLIGHADLEICRVNVIHQSCQNWHHPS